MAHPETESYLSVEHATKRFGDFTALKNISFSAGTGEFISVLGPSGCGKTTLLRIIAGLDPLTTGRVRIQGRDVSDLPVSRRNVGIVFQSYALFPNLSAARNIAYGLAGREKGRAAVARRVEELLDLVGLSGMGDRFPAQLSGGQQQRVALARAMALSPDLLLLDEPLSALDAQVRVMLRSEIRSLQKRLGITTLMVTHDQEEALTMADRILVISEGELVQSGAPDDIYDKPATPFVAAFIGSMNFIPEAVKVDANRYRIGCHDLRICTENGAHALPAGHPVTLAIRPEDVAVSTESSREANILKARIRNIEYRGPLFRISLTLPIGEEAVKWIDADLTAEKARRMELREAMEVPIHLPEDRLRVYAHPRVPA